MPGLVLAYDRGKFNNKIGIEEENLSMESLLKRVEEIVNAFDQVTSEYGDTYVAGSQMEKEINSYPDKPRINEPFNFAKLNLKAGREQLATMPDLIRGEKILTNPVAARAVLESTTLALWLLEPRIDDKERVARGLFRLCDGKNQLRKLHTDGGDAVAVDQINAFFDIRLPTILASNGITLPGKTPIVDLIRQVLGDEFRVAYRILSGFAHGQHSILLTFGYDFANAAGTGAVKTVAYKPNEQIQLYSLSIAVRAYEKALQTLFSISGWDFEKIKSTFDNFTAELGETISNNKE